MRRFGTHRLLIADRNFYNWRDWRAAADTGAALLWRMKVNSRLPVLEVLPDRSYRSVLVDPALQGARRQALTEAARRGEDLDPDQARYVRIVEYEVPDRDGSGEPVIVATPITSWQAAPAQELAAAYQQRWEHETGNAELKTCLRGPGKVLRSQSPDLARQEIWGYLLAHYAISALICAAATSAGTDPDRVKFKRTLRIIRRAVGPAFPPDHTRALLARVTATSPQPGTSTHRAGTAATPGSSNAPAQRLPRQTTRRPRNPAPRTTHHPGRHPGKTPGSSMIHLR